LHGQGTYTGEKPEGQSGNINEDSGDFSPSGEGKNQYNGYWNHGMKHGHGIFTWVDGSKYEGNFKDDLFNGVGEYARADGKHYKGKLP
jgi:hypothetical protein